MKRILGIAIIFCCLLQGNVFATIRYVKASGNGNGSSWSNASGDLQLMIDSSSAGDEVWVAGGNYKPTRSALNTSIVSTNNRRNSFVIRNGVSVYGGFLGTGIFANLRAPNSYISELDGDIGTLNDSTDNAYHVVTMANGYGMLLDGFTIQNGNANGQLDTVINTVWVSSKGGAAIAAKSVGAYNIPNSWDMHINNCIIQNNHATDGGAVMCDYAELLMENVQFINNTGDTTAALHITGGADMLIKYCQFSGNSAIRNIVDLSGGSNLMVKFYNSIFTGNEVTSNTYPGYYPAIFNNNSDTNTTTSLLGTILLNCVFSGNKNGSNQAYTIARNKGRIDLQNCIISGNAGAYTAPSSTCTYNNCIGIWGFTQAAGSANNIAADPSFVNAPSYTTAPFTNGDYHLTACSPAINVGDNSYLSTPSYFYFPAYTDSLDIDGHKRIIATTVDIGAYEYAMGTPDTNGIVYVDSSSTSNGMGNSWANAIPELADALKAAHYDTSIHEIRVAQGTYIPLYTADSLLCNTNNNRKKSFVIPDGVSVMGGYVNGAITYTSGFPQNPSILSGDIGVANNINDNSYHVVIAAGTNNTNTKLYNFIVEKGANDASAPTITVNGISISGIMGSAMVNQANAQGNTTNKGADILYCTFRDNIGYYGALSNAFCNNVTVFGAKVIRDSSGSGGGIANLGPGTVHIDHSRISGNKAFFEGGGIFNRKCNVYIYNSLITANYASGLGGGGIKSDSSNIVIGNCTVANNKSTYNYGGFDHSNTGGTQMATITNSIFWGNEAVTYMNFDTTNNPLISVINCIAGTEKYNYGINVSDNTPMFMYPVLAMYAPIDTGDYHLSMCSPAINAGNNSYTPYPYYSDMEGGLRVEQNIIDLGPYETLGRTVSQTVGDSIGNTNFLNGCYFTEYTSPSNGKVWGNIFNANDNLIASYNEANGIGTAISSSLYPVIFYSKLRTQYATGNTTQLNNPFGQTGYYYPANRSWTFTANGTIAAPVRLRIYFDATDSTDIASQTNFGTMQNLIVYKVNGNDAYNTAATGYKQYTYAATADTNHFSLGTYQGVRYAEIVVNSFSSVGIALKTNNPLALQLGNIIATNVDKRNRIDWNTLSEESGDRLMLERSKDAQQFETISNIDLKGKPSNYTYWDESPVSGINYYRLRMQSAEGNNTYSKTVQAFVNDGNVFYVKAFPNPATNKMNVEIIGMQEGNAQISIMDMTGRIISSQKVQSQEMSMDLSALSSGVYFLKYQDGAHRETLKIEKKNND